MALSIDPTNAAVLTATQPGLGSASRMQAFAEDSASAVPATLAADDPKADAAKLANALKALSLNLKLGSDAEHVASALVSSMQELIAQRPDLANAQFDFQADNGSIKVTSNSLRDSDRKWLQDMLNSNGALVQAVNTFHDDAVASYSTAADSSGSSLTNDQLDSVSKQADNLVGFMELFKRFGTDATRNLNSQDSFYDSDGAKIDLTQNPETATGFLSFMHGAQALANGTAADVSPSGRVFYGTKINVFDNWDALPQFYPSDMTSLGVHVIV
ncbi:hypothetical protein [Paraburkholderia humisilvae]|uniref:Uncharacterized protein n=1 Tax=Paraburkholderia humisilvae TaxID=627669 RepID=A0A6J5EUL2_9BURK|nr:hypothetical protein [Paraburkholderia humisilvae]CAB3770249.1 hypothetical protein LMG29542_06303 [Paraburkholderia humisilvae]